MSKVKVSLFVILFSAGSVSAEEPLSAIDWLKNPLPSVKAAPVPIEQPEPRLPVTDSAVVPEIQVTPLSEIEPKAIGLLPESVTGLPGTLWQGDSTGQLTKTLDKLPAAPLPALQALIFTVLLAEAEAPPGEGIDYDLLKSRVHALMKYGAVYQANALLERAGPEKPELFDLWFGTSLLLNTPDKACDFVTKDQTLTKSYADRIYCQARLGDWNSASLTFESANALGLLSTEEHALLAIYLDPELTDVNPPTPDLTKMTPLTYRLWEVAGQRVSSTGLPLEYAVTDLDDVAGWKGQLEAAERLARSGALGASHLLELYTGQKPSASGGVWDRVADMQRLALVIKRQDPPAIETAIGRAWESMGQAGLQSLLGDLFTDIAGEVKPIGEIWLKVGLLSPDYQTIANSVMPVVGEMAFPVSLALGAPNTMAAQSDLEHAIADAFSAVPELETEMPDKSLGRDILDTVRELSNARQDLNVVTRSIARLRAFGLEDTARRTALQLLLLPGAYDATLR